MKIKTLIPFTAKDGDDFISPRKGEILDVSDEAGASLIADGYAEAYTLVEPSGWIEIRENNPDVDVAQYAKAMVNVKGWERIIEFTPFSSLTDEQIAALAQNETTGVMMDGTMTVAGQTAQVHFFGNTAFRHAFGEHTEYYCFCTLMSDGSTGVQLILKFEMTRDQETDPYTYSATIDLCQMLSGGTWTDVTALTTISSFEIWKDVGAK